MRGTLGRNTINKVGDGKALAKVCYYGTKASGDDGFFTEENGYGNLSAGARFILVHLAASYANGSSDAFSGANATAQNLAKKLYNYCISQPDIPDVAMSFSDADVTAYVDGNSQRTKEIIFKADELQSITMKLPSGVKLHNVTTGKTSKAGEAVEISGGTKFYLSAPLTQVQDVAGSWSATMKGSVTKDYSAYKISTGSGSQDLALVFGEGVDDEKYVDFKVTWVQHASVKVIKKDAKADAKLSGAVFGLYSDANCTKLITKLPATDILLTMTERLTMNGRPKNPKFARNKNVIVIGGSGSGKTRFYVKPNLMQMGKYISYVVTDPKGTIIIECGKMLVRHGYKVKVLNTINFSKSMHYNPFHYIHSEKDILKLVNTIMVNTKGEGEKSSEDFWTSATRSQTVKSLRTSNGFPLFGELVV